MPHDRLPDRNIASRRRRIDLVSAKAELAQTADRADSAEGQVSDHEAYVLATVLDLLRAWGYPAAALAIELEGIERLRRCGVAI